VHWKREGLLGRAGCSAAQGLACEAARLAGGDTSPTAEQSTADSLEEAVTNQSSATPLQL